MSIKVHKTFGNSFVLDEPELRRIHKVLSDQMAQATKDNNFTTTFNLKLKNQMTFQKTSLEDVLSESNGSENEIQELEISIEDRNRNEISLQLMKNTTLSIIYRINGDDRSWVSITQSLIEERIKNIKPAFIVSGSARFFLTAFLFFILIIIFAIILSIFLTSFNSPHSSGYIVVPIRNAIIFLISMILLASGILSYLYCFPPQNFCWGDYVKVYQRRQSIGNIIIIVVIIGLIISVVGSIIASYFLTK